MKRKVSLKEVIIMTSEKKCLGCGILLQDENIWNNLETVSRK